MVRAKISYKEVGRLCENVILKRTLIILNETRPNATYVQKLNVAKKLMVTAITLLEERVKAKRRARRLRHRMRTSTKVAVRRVPYPYASYNFR